MGRERKRIEGQEENCDKHSFCEAQRLTLVRLPKSPRPLAPPACSRPPPPGASKSLKNRLKISLVFWSAFGSLLGPKMEPKMLPNRSREPLKTHLASEAVFGHVFDRFLDDFWPLGPLKLMLPCRRQHVFQKICFSGLGQKKDPKMSPKTTPKRAQEASRCTKMASQTAAEISTKFRLHFGRFWEPKWAPKWTPKSLKNQLWNPRAAQRPPGSHLDAIWEPFGSHF